MYNFTSCVVCKCPITDPICRGCYIKQTLILLNDLEVDSIISNFIKSKLKSIFYLENLNDFGCILCKKDGLSICRYCFSITLIGILREINFSEDLIKNFEYNSIVEEKMFENEVLM